MEVFILPTSITAQLLAHLLFALVAQVSIKDGGSTPDTLYKKRYSMAVQWQALQDAKQGGQLSYDLCGIPPLQQLQNPLHPYYGVGQFKLKFKKDITEYCGCYDQILKPFQYYCWIRLQHFIYKAYLMKYGDLFF